MPNSTGVIAHPAATVVLLREAADGCEVLLVRRNAQLSFHGGAWVFPGGRIDPEDYAAAGSDDPAAAACWAAVREAQEEAGVDVARDELVMLSRWITPEGLPKRFDTWMFVARTTAAAVEIDGGEIHAHCWMRAAQAIEAHRGGGMDLPPPTFVTLASIAAHADVDAVLAMAGRGPVETFRPRFHPTAGGACGLYSGDAAYESGELDRPGPRHRLWMIDDGWRYERTA